jgi:hypothetical protein
VSDDQNPTIPIPLHRIRVAAGLRDLASFIERNPDLPIPRNVDISLSVIGDDDKQERDEIDRIAAILGVPATFPYGLHHYRAAREFGPVTFSALAISQEYMRMHHARTALIDIINESGEIGSEEWPI